MKSRQTTVKPEKSSHTHRWTWGILFVIILISAFIRFGMLDVPLERDEGEYAYAGQLILDGVPPYKELYTMKLPGIQAAYAGILAIFGQTHRSIHLALLFINAATILLIFLLGKRLIGISGGLMSAASFAVLSVGQAIQGVFANAEHFVILFAVGGLLVLLKALDEERPWLIFCGGILLGTGFLMKQHGVMFVACGGLYTFIYQIQKRQLKWLQVVYRCAVFVVGSLAPYGLVCMILASVGVFEKFWFWTVNYPMAYTSQIPLEYAWETLKHRGDIINSAPLLWILVAIGLTALIWDKKIRHHWIFILLFTIFSFAAICPGFYFRPHYFILLLPAAAILTGCAISATKGKLSVFKLLVIRKGIPAFLAVICLFISVWQQRDFLFFMTPVEASRTTYEGHFFPETLEIGRFLRENADDNDRVAVMGSEPQIFSTPANVLPRDMSICTR